MILFSAFIFSLNSQSHLKIVFINCPQLPNCVKTLKLNITVVLKQSSFVLFFFFP